MFREDDCTCTKCEEEEFNLLTFWEQMNEIKLERNHVNGALRDQSFLCTHKTHAPVTLRRHLSLNMEPSNHGGVVKVEPRPPALVKHPG